MSEQRRELVGQLIKDETNRRGIHSADGYAKFYGYAKSNVQTRLFHGTVNDRRLRETEGKLEIPAYFFDYVLKHDTAAIEALDMLPEHEPMRQRALRELRAMGDELAEEKWGNGNGQ